VSTLATTVLLVDDNPADSDLTSEVLLRNPQTRIVHTALDGMEAMEFLRKQGRFSAAGAPDLVLLDLNLPRKDGKAVLKEIKDDPGLRHTPVVIFSTSQAGRDILSSYELGANSYVQKPGTLSEFVRAVTSIAEFWSRCASFSRKEN
jgi:two-component system, chemotaxis family, response regulator Rcp1